MDRLTGDPEGIAALKALATEHRDFFKFLLAEVQSNLDHNAQFTAADGTKYVLHTDSTGHLTVKRAT
jgi:hypothetical protein